MIAGVCGHPGDLLPYGASNQPNWVSLATQITQLQALGAQIYRIDGDDATIGAEVGAACNAVGIAILPIVCGVTDTTLDGIATDSASLLALEATCKANAKAYALAVDQYTYNHTFEVSNERDNYSISSGDVDGSLIAHYDTDDLKRVYWSMKGIIAGIKEAVPSANLIINYSGWYHYAFWQFVCNPSQFAAFSGYAPLNFDIIGLHIYNTDGNLFYLNATNTGASPKPITYLDQFGKRYWLTEFGRKYGSYESKFTQQAFAFETWAWENISWFKDRIECAIVYELLDQSPTLATDEGSYGLSRVSYSNPTYSLSTNKVAFNAVKNLITKIKQIGHK